MNVSLTRELERLMDEKVKTGVYQSASGVIREGPRIRKARDDHHAQLGEQIRAGFAAIERGEYEEFVARHAGWNRGSGAFRCASTRSTTAGRPAGES